MRYEMKVFALRGNPHELEKKLCELGAEGWAIAGAVETLVVLQRPIGAPPATTVYNMNYDPGDMAQALAKAVRDAIQNPKR
jgi:hypothetical protein